MMTDIHDVLQNMRSLQEQLEAAFDEAREKFRCTLQDGRIRIAEEASRIFGG